MTEKAGNYFRDVMTKEANHLLSQIKGEKNRVRKYQLCENLLEIYEELDIDVQNNHSLWSEIQMSYDEFIIE